MTREGRLELDADESGRRADMVVEPGESPQPTTWEVLVADAWLRIGVVLTEANFSEVIDRMRDAYGITEEEVRATLALVDHAAGTTPKASA
jgi:hypothetical protein